MLRHLVEDALVDALRHSHALDQRRLLLGAVVVAHEFLFFLLVQYSPEFCCLNLRWHVHLNHWPRLSHVVVIAPDLGVCVLFVD